MQVKDLIVTGNARILGNLYTNTKITVDSALSNTSINPVQNKVIKAALDAKAPAYTYGTADVTVGGTSSAATGTLHFVYE